MNATIRRWKILLVLSSGTLLQSSCDGYTGAILDTIGLAFGIADIWV